MQLNERATHDGSGAPLDDACGSIDNRRPLLRGHSIQPARASFRRRISPAHSFRNP
ncbi:hypothetical protein ABXK61_34010 [Burkholderia sola]|nr:hypothetical protein [Burkholderia sp. AcTa6-5]